jgi:iron complex transport system substrate-binding protein
MASASDQRRPERIVSLLPSATEVLYYLGVGDRVVGVTYECNEPPEAASLPHLTDTIVPVGAKPEEIDRLISAAMEAGEPLYTLDRDLLATLDPDLIVTQDLCRVCALPAGDVTAAVAELGCTDNVVTYDPKTLDGVLDEMEALAHRVGAPAHGRQRIDGLRTRLAEQRRRADALETRPRVLLLEWPDPPYTPGHWIPDQLEAAGGEVLLGHPGQRSSATTWAEVADSAAEVVIVAPCGFDQAAAQEQLAEVLARPELAELPAIRSGRCYAVDADAWIVRPGPRLIDGVDRLQELLHRPAGVS